jgi:1-acyl-sn-glycerol-3-phosphate acyltransferase
MFGWVAKAELGRVPFLGWAIKASPSVFVDRSQPRKSVESIHTAAEKIRGGVSVAIFPEGSRSYSGELGPFMRGAFVLAIEAGVPVVPVTIKNAHELFNEKTKLARPGTLHITVGKPIAIDGWTRSDIPRLMEEVRIAMQSELDAWSRTDQPSVALSASSLAKSLLPEQDIEQEI